ncbi:MAG: DUF3039 domain-containing protein [Bifidobacteriaceae bacterium]|jgi:hypothetical protein|nr:DUF3039 domain-containing protein [Bifidobacteriaceae bacterium]MCI1979179.1 DUF3039 domain-containing protein [Bifidobacteriaceae bacterium]
MSMSTDSLSPDFIDLAEPPRSQPESAPGPDQQAGTAVLERPETSESASVDDGEDRDRYAHYVSKERIAESRLTGRPVVALCGKVWVPKKDPSNYPICPDCKRIFDEMGKI